ncbi:MAG: ABC transporter substrate binding protein [Methylotenera sp.]|nr:ABC transporter substrate binding protein [Methylotenera sp.]
MNSLVSFTLVISLVMPCFAHAYTGVTIVMTAPTQANLEFVDQFKAELAKRKHINLRTNVITLSVAEKLVVAENSELVIALGVKALEASSKLKHTTPVIGVFTPLPAFNSLLLKSKRELGNFSAIVLDQPYARQMSLIKQVLPEAKTLGILLGSTSSQYGDFLKEEGEKSGFSILEENVNQEADLIPKLKKLLEITDALVAIPDPLIYSRETAQPILLTSYRHQKPIFGYSQSYVRAGGLAAVYSSSKQLAKQAAEIAIKSQQAPSELPLPQAPKYFSIMLNYQVARSLNIPLQDEETIYKKMLGPDAKEGNGE